MVLSHTVLNSQFFASISSYEKSGWDIRKRCPDCGGTMILMDITYWFCLRCYIKEMPR